MGECSVLDLESRLGVLPTAALSCMLSATTGTRVTLSIAAFGL
jgi:hypothetical protein